MIQQSFQDDQICNNGYLKYITSQYQCICFPGYIYDSPQKEQCIECGMNQISPGNSYDLGTTCSQCNGSSSILQAPNLNKSQCVQCDSTGFYNLSFGNLCKCPAGTYMSSENYQCIQCPNETYSSVQSIRNSNSPSQQVCQECVGTNYQVNAYQTLCVCRDGYYDFSGGQTNCQTMLSSQTYIAYNTYLNESNLIYKLEACTNGQVPNISYMQGQICSCYIGYMVDPITHNCINCGNQSYQPLDNYLLSTCTECGENLMRDSVNDAQYCECKPGYQLDNQTSQCIACQYDQFKYDISNTTQCQDCNGTNTFSPQRTMCTCQYSTGVQIYYQNVTNQTSFCTQTCNTTGQSGSGGNTQTHYQFISWDNATSIQQCSQCPSNYRISLSRQECVCGYGFYLQGGNCIQVSNVQNATYYYSNYDGSVCDQCPNATTSINNNSACICPDGQFWNETICDVCPEYQTIQMSSSNQTSTCSCRSNQLTWQYNPKQNRYMCMCSGFNQYFNLATQSCQSCEYTQFAYNDDDDAFCSCGVNYVLNSNQQCVCPENTYFIDSDQECQQCSAQHSRTIDQDQQKCYYVGSQIWDFY